MKTTIVFTILIFAVGLSIFGMNQKDTTTNEDERIRETANSLEALSGPNDSKNWSYLWNAKLKETKTLGLFVLSAVLASIVIVNQLLKVNISFYALNLVFLLIPYNITFILLHLVLAFSAGFILLAIVMRITMKQDRYILNVSNIYPRSLFFIYLLVCFIAMPFILALTFPVTFFASSTYLAFYISMSCFLYLAGLSLWSIATFVKATDTNYSVYFFPIRLKQYSSTDCSITHDSNSTRLRIKRIFYEKK